MNVTFAPKGIVQIDDARICFRNFKGAGSKYNREGDRNFAIVIPSQDIADALMQDVNEYEVGWNVHVKPPKEEGDTPFMYLPVKIKFNGRGPAIYICSGRGTYKMDESEVGQLDEIDIDHVDLDIRPYDDVVNGKPFRAAYLQSIRITQHVDRFAKDYEERE